MRTRAHTHTYIKIDLDIDIITYIVDNIQHSLFIVIGIFYSIGLWVMCVDHTENNRQIKSKHWRSWIMDLLLSKAVQK